MKEEKTEAETDDKSILSALQIIGLFGYTQLMYFLTRYYPFSEFFRDRRFHYKMRHLSKAYDTLFFYGLETISYNFDQFFVRVVFTINPKQVPGKDKKFREVIKHLNSAFHTKKNISIHPNENENLYFLQIPTTYIFPKS